MSQSKVIERRRQRASFPGYWSEFLRTHYHNPEEVAVAFDVRYQTALNWWQGANRPLGDVVAFAGRAFLDFMDRRAA